MPEQNKINSFRIIHIGDLHFWGVPFHPKYYLGKRILGVGNLILRRSREFDFRRLPDFQIRLNKVGADYWLFSGDFSTTSLPAEFAAASTALKLILGAEGLKKAVAVPGNHDCYTRRDLDSQAFSLGLREILNPVSGVFFEQLTPGLNLIALNGATSNGIGSHGALKDADFQAIQAKLKEWEGDQTLKQVLFLCHFPSEAPLQLMKKDRGDQFLNSDRLLKAFEGFSRPLLWLHGHHHYRWIYRSSIASNVVYLNAGAPFLKRKLPLPDLGFHEINWNGEELSARTHRLPPTSNNWEMKKVKFPTEAGEATSL